MDFLKKDQTLEIKSECKGIDKRDDLQEEGKRTVVGKETGSWRNRRQTAHVTLS